MGTSTTTSSAATGGALTTLTTTTTQVVRWKDHPNKMEAPKTVITIMGGRGYINWRRASVEKQRTSALAQINNSDAFLFIVHSKKKLLKKFDTVILFAFLMSILL